MTNISQQKIQQITGFTPHEKQRLILDSTSRDKTIVAGRRLGKSEICAYIAILELLQPGKHIWIVAPTYELASKVFDYVVRFYVKLFPSQAASISYRPFPKIKTPQGSWIECKSTENPTGLLGEELDLVIVDEAARIQRRIWETYIFPTTTTRQGKSIFISTPFGKNWFHEQWVKGKETGGSFRFISTDNPYWHTTHLKECTPEYCTEWERTKSKLPENVFKQEMMAEFLDDAAAVFRGIKDIFGPCLSDVNEARRYVMGVDLAKYRDFTVLTVIDTVTHNVVYWDRFKDLSYVLQKVRIIEVAKRYHARIIIDSTGVGDPISEDIAREGIIVDDFKFSNKSKMQLVEKLSVFIEQKSITIPDNDVLISELECFGYEISEAGNVKYGAPQGLHDDCVMSLGLAVWGLMSPRRQRDKHGLAGILDTKSEAPRQHRPQYV